MYAIRSYYASPQFKDISNLLHFTEEESHILKRAIDSIDENNLMKQNLKRKLGTVYDYKILAETLVKSKNSDNIRITSYNVCYTKLLRLFAKQVLY